MAIKLGKKKESERKAYWKATCKKCGCIFLASQDDVDHDGFQYNEYCYSETKCPDCGAKVTFNKNNKESIPSQEELKVIDGMSKPLPDRDDIVKAYRMFDTYGLIKNDLCFDPEHFIDTVVMPHWRDF